MISFRTEFRNPQFRADALARNSSVLASKVAATYSNHFKLALVKYGSIATGKTLRSVEPKNILDSAGRGEFRRAVIARSSWIYIQLGRRPKRKQPPLSAMIEWFQTLNIPRAAWFPILRAIARRGIKPKPIREEMLRQAHQPVERLASQYAEIIARELFTTKGANVQVNR